MLALRRSIVASGVRQSALKATSMRPFSRSAMLREVQLFDMPSMSPTMEEGGIVEWKVKQGDSFAAGDVLLEIETDKAEIAVEAGDDGVLAAILIENGAKGIPVGKPIAVTAEPDDDISSLNIEALLAARGGSGEAKDATKETPKEEPPKAQAPKSEPAANKPAAEESHVMHGKFGTEPLPTAMRLLHENHLDPKDIKGTGPYGRVTKGDVLAHLGKISKEYVAEEAARFSKLQKMDLSNVKAVPRNADSASGVASDQAGSPDAAVAAKPLKPQPLVTKVSLPIVDAAIVPRLASIQRAALRDALLSLQPRPSVLRDAALDRLTASTRPPFVVKSARVVVLRAKPVSFDVVVEEPPKAKSSKAVAVFIEKLRAELAPVESML